MGFFQHVTSELNYEWSSDEDEGKLNPAVPTSRFDGVSSAELDELEKTKNEAYTVRQSSDSQLCFHPPLISLAAQSMATCGSICILTQSSVVPAVSAWHSCSLVAPRCQGNNESLVLRELFLSAEPNNILKI